MAEEIVVLVAVMAVAAVETVAAETEIVKDVAGNYLPRRERIYAFPTTMRTPKINKFKFPNEQKTPDSPKHL